MCTKIQVDILNNAEFWYLKGPKRPFFKLFPGIYVFSWFSIFSDLDRLQSV